VILWCDGTTGNSKYELCGGCSGIYKGKASATIKKFHTLLFQLGTFTRTMVAHWDQKGVIQKVKEDYKPTEDVLQASYDRLLTVIKEKIAEIQRQGPKVCINA
jgi:hypothetical protein